MSWNVATSAGRVFASVYKERMGVDGCVHGGPLLLHGTSNYNTPWHLTLSAPGRRYFASTRTGEDARPYTGDVLAVYKGPLERQFSLDDTINCFALKRGKGDKEIDAGVFKVRL